MFNVEFQTGALLLLAVAGLLISWTSWAERNDRREAARQTLEGVGHELRITIQRFMVELAGVTRGQMVQGGELMAVTHPQLDAVYAAMINANRNALSVIGATYQTLHARKLDIRAAWAHGQDARAEADEAVDAVIDAIVTLYLWEEHDGRRPADTRETRSWHVRQWMKGHGWRQSDIFPGMHLRDEVVRRLRAYGMTLTPQPLSHTAHEYYSLRYDRNADPHGPFGHRRASGANGPAGARAGMA